MTVDVQVARETDWMARAIELATRSVADGGGPFGAVVVKDGEIVATGHNQVTTNLDPTAHAEVVAIRNACQALGTFKLDGCVLVTSCEPCPMCMASALWARMESVVYAADRDDAAVAGFDDRAFYQLFSDPDSVWPTPVRRIEMPNRNEAFDAWRQKEDRVDY
ncbi:guanine deaminase [Saccharopolyspora erythraea NRRL 2338]|uniref:Guanine deaminase n=2 Tax=Saccharopolyspora erythraea TaxID=1836 RepID=A4F960_SACEN|nr:nucleoside deaminase [Saccharopolyspora erythraea]EQD87173.1 cytosine deaminase [Saccharopolyspora erythraea D]PFG94377.1 guanine deaminase [Saccharopolyspora erythraea NRRL 2338]QRK91145.1 nucleoside deaminase [Saccharopolyspora erythraea]CAM00585.1 guanine deaminase [Saccharopolyspora erythraea NRRL 2338]